MKSILDAIGVLQVDDAARPEVSRAHKQLITRLLRLEKCVGAYGNRDNYIDGVFYHIDPTDGLLSIPDDEGEYARQAQGEDVLLGLFVRKEAA